MERQAGFRFNSCTFLILFVVLVATGACQNSDRTGNIATTTSNANNSSAPIGVASRDEKASDKPKCVTPEMKATIQITEVPSRGAGPDVLERIAGTASGVNETECKVVIFAHTDSWYVQPYIDSPYTSISADCKWESDTHLGSEYVAFLVKPDYKPPSKTGTLPTIGGPVLALAKMAAKK